jgi:hypothetical protein
MMLFDSLNDFCMSRFGIGHLGIKGFAGRYGSKDFDQFLRLFPVLLEARASREWLGIHYDLPFLNAPGVRPNQAERRFVTLLEN